MTPPRSRGLGCLLRAVLVGVIVIVALRIAAPSLLHGYARWLVVDRPLERSDVLVVLGGAEGERLAAALRLYRAGISGRVLILGTDNPLLQIYVGEDSLSQAEVKRRIAVKKGVPAESVFVAIGPMSTWEEAERTLSEARLHHWKSVLVVTDPYHTRRSWQTFRHVFRDEPIEVGVTHLPIDQSRQRVRHWWRSEGDMMAVGTETVKILFYAYRHGVRR